MEPIVISETELDNRCYEYNSIKYAIDFIDKAIKEIVDIENTDNEFEQLTNIKEDLNDKMLELSNQIDIIQDGLDELTEEQRAYGD